MREKTIFTRFTTDTIKQQTNTTFSSLNVIFTVYLTINVNKCLTERRHLSWQHLIPRSSQFCNILNHKMFSIITKVYKLGQSFDFIYVTKYSVLDIYHILCTAGPYCPTVCSPDMCCCPSLPCNSPYHR